MSEIVVAEKPYFNVVIVGHVDHGKSTLIGRLLYDTGSIAPDKLETVRQACEEIGKPFEFAYITDQIREEREQGITIDTTQIYFHTDARNYVIIDAPGHREFTKNMITGASQAEGAILVVDALEGVREQTRRHAYLLKFLGLRENIVLVNKMDLVEHSEATFQAIGQEIAEFFGSLGISQYTLIPVSAAAGDNIATKSDAMSWYTGPTALEALDALQKRTLLIDRPFRMPVQDVYRFDDTPIVAGRIESGGVRAGDQVGLWPAGDTVTVSEVLEFGRTRKGAAFGECIGLTLAEDTPVARGMMLTARDSAPAVTTTVHGTLFWMNPKPLHVGEEIVFRLNTQETACRVTAIAHRIDSSTLELIAERSDQLDETEVGEVTIETEAPVLLESFVEMPELGRFVLERRNDIVAGGIITLG